MSLLKFDMNKCSLCGQCISICPFSALSIKHDGLAVSDACRLCKLCIKNCPQKAISLEQVMDAFDKSQWKDFLIFAEQDNGAIHPVTYELIGEAQKMAEKAGYKVNCVIAGGNGTEKNAEKLLDYGVDCVYVYENDMLSVFRPDVFTDVLSDIISLVKPCSVLIGGTSAGRSLAPRLSTRFHTGLTADCTSLDIQENSDMVQIRPAFGGNIMAQIAITHSRPQFATVRYRVFDKAEKTEHPHGKIIIRNATEQMCASRTEVISSSIIEKIRSIEEEDILVVAGRGAAAGNGIELCQGLADALGCQLAYTRPMVEMGYGDVSHQVGLSGRTVRPRLLITCGVSGAIQFTTCIQGADCIVSINSDRSARIFDFANYCIIDDLNVVVPALTELIKQSKEI